jgi:hypothetical protein
MWIRAFWTVGGKSTRGGTRRGKSRKERKNRGSTDPLRLLKRQHSGNEYKETDQNHDGHVGRLDG